MNSTRDNRQTPDTRHDQTRDSLLIIPLSFINIVVFSIVIIISDLDTSILSDLDTSILFLHSIRLVSALHTSNTRNHHAPSHQPLTTKSVLVSSDPDVNARS